ncbi:MAG: thiamine diphosphokinase [Synergistaceae bacterium]|jgi:thiamine pyrophosphokinase|nr:thiamine diphosphokinase [Synergistaceae bacterium]
MAGRPPLLSSLDIDIFTSTGDADRGKRTLFVLGGRRPDPEWLADFAGRNSPEVWAVDSGVASCRASGFAPSVILGDRDSASPEDWEWALDLGAKEHLHPRAKDLTDFQLALDLWSGGRGKNGGAVLLLSGCFGGRFDHLQSTIYTLAFHEPIELKKENRRCMIDEVEGVYMLSGGESALFEFNRTPLAISLLPLTNECRGVSIAGVRWPLYRETLCRSLPWAISNELAGNKGSTEVSCLDGILAVYWRFGAE